RGGARARRAGAVHPDRDGAGPGRADAELRGRLRPARRRRRAGAGLRLRAWAAYDIRALLERRWTELGPRLQGKLHLVVGGADTYHLEGPTRRLCDFLARAGRPTSSDILPVLDPFNRCSPSATYPDYLVQRFGREMIAPFYASR